MQRNNSSKTSISSATHWLANTWHKKQLKRCSHGSALANFSSIRYAMVLILLACSGHVSSQALAQDFTDVESPSIVHELVSTGEPGTDQTFIALITDNDEIKSVTLFYRLSPEKQYQEMMMSPTDTESQYAAVIMTTSATAAVEYYIKAVDTADNSVQKGRRSVPLVRQLSDTNSGTSRRSKVVYYVLGALVAGAVISQVGSDDKDSSAACPDANGCTVTVSLPQP